jgi:hypothetical protein
VQHLLNPPCLDADGAAVAAQPASGSAACSTGSRAFAPVTDLHLGVITTSLGSHGGAVCAPGVADSAQQLDDQAELIPAHRALVASYLSSGFASFDASGKTGDTDANVVSAEAAAMITAAGETGCGFEAPLEAMYGFLVDPEPPTCVQKVGSESQPTSVNQELLQERAAFLRPKSSVAVVILSDENDCSIVDSGVGWFVGATSRMPRATTACASDANDPCCRSCAENESSPAAGCAPLSADDNCGAGPVFGSDLPRRRCVDARGSLANVGRRSFTQSSPERPADGRISCAAHRQKPDHQRRPRPRHVAKSERKSQQWPRDERR